MATLKVDGLTVSVKGYYLNNNSPYYQVFVPKQLRPLFGQYKASVALYGNNKRQHIDQCQQLNQRFRALFNSVRNNKTQAPKSLHFVAHAWLSEITAEIEANTVEIPVLLSDAFELYVGNHENGSDELFRVKQFAHWQRFMHLAGNGSLKSLTREDARSYRDSRLASGVKQSSVQREIGSIKAIINVAIREIPLAINNPFDGLVVNAPTVEHKSIERLPYTREEVQRLINEALKIGDERRRIVVVLALTGARLAEVLGLRKQDVCVAEGAIHITEHASRSLKTLTSKRSVPLHPIALEALQRQLEAHSGQYVFPSYCNDKATKANSASAAINKWAKGIVPNKTMHSFRHTMRDQLREVGCPDSVAKEIGGWSNGSDASSGYGQGPSINVRRRWLTEAYSWFELCGPQQPPQNY